jgi:nuclear pore complex protein Nup133
MIVATKEKSIEAYVQSHATGLASRPALEALFARSAGRLIDGQALNLEDLIDVLTLKDNRGQSVNDPVIALDRLVRDTVSLAAILGCISLILVTA